MGQIYKILKLLLLYIYQQGSFLLFVMSVDHSTIFSNRPNMSSLVLPGFQCYEDV